MARNASAEHSETRPESIGTYRRVVGASLERIWENVLDWEHLPWLHKDSFAGLRPVHHDELGWRAVVEFPAGQGGGEAEIELTTDRENNCYTTRTLSGEGAGTEIFTALDPIDFGSTRILVDFRVPGVSQADAEAVAEFLKSLYAHLWDEDEAMMVEREEALLRMAEQRKAPRRPDRERDPIPLGNEASVRSRAPFVIEIAGRKFRIVEHGGELLAHAVLCPHRGGPLSEVAVEEGCVRCPWHGYRFDVRSGLSTDGKALRLGAAPQVRVTGPGGDAYLAWD